jgi:rhamnosyltransferase
LWGKLFEVNNMVDISIIIPTKNGGVNLATCLEAIHRQEIDGEIETIVVDSGSRDDTLRIAQRFSARVTEIRPEKFTHGRSRNLGASIACGKYLIFCNQDVIPANIHWLARLVEALGGKGVAASYSRQVPPPGAQRFEKVFLERHYPPVSVIHTRDVLNRRGPEDIILFSTVAGALRRNVWETFRFNENIVTSEDQEIAYRLLKSGWQIVYQADSIVCHSNQYTLLSAFRRYFDSGWSMTYYPELRVRSSRRAISYLKASCKDSILCDAASLRERLGSLLYVGAKTTGFVLGQTAFAMPVYIRDRISYTRSLLRGRTG